MHQFAALASISLVWASEPACALPSHRSDPRLLSALSVEASEWPGDLLGALEDNPAGSFAAVVEPAVSAITVTYQSCSGQTYDESLKDATVDGYKRVPELEVDPEDGGVHARVFADDTAKKVIVAFRGACLSDAYPQCQMDKCFLQRLGAMGNMSSLTYSTNTSCDAFTNSFNYVEQAQSVVAKAQAQLKGYSMLLVGHSLGGALSIVVASQQPGTLKALTVAPTPFQYMLKKDLSLSVDEVSKFSSGDLVALGDPYDLGINAHFVPDARNGATTCVLQGAQEPPICDEDFLESIPTNKTLAIRSLQCKGMAHDWDRYRNILVQRTKEGQPFYAYQCK